MNRITDYLMAEHVRLLRSLDTAARAKSFDRDAYADFRAGLLRHIAIEEKLLLPAARRARGGVPIDRAHRLRIEHGAIGALLVPTPDHALCGELASILYGHDALEEGDDGVYAECEALLSAAESSELLARACAFPDVRVAAHFDGQGTCRTAKEALASASRIVAPKTVRSPD